MKPLRQNKQVDWGYCGRFAGPQGKFISVYVFVMVLCFSRMLFIKFTTSMRLPVLLTCHLEAFRFFGVWTALLLYDNMKQVRINQQEWNPQFLDFANYYGIVPKTCRIGRPRTKGKVERPVHYVKNNFLNGRSFADLEDLNLQALHWLNNTANVRIHGTTGRRPVDLFSQEKLTPYASIAPYRYHPWLPRKVDFESFVRLNRSRYCVPPENVGKKVFVQQRIIRKATKHPKLIRQKFQDLNISLPKNGAGLPTDLGDIYEICHKYITAIEAMLKVGKKNKKDVVSLLSIINSELYIHLPYHLKRLRKPLDELIESLE